MASRATYELHHHFPKLAEESGFTFNVHRPRTHVDWHKIRSIDIESMVKERKFHLIEQHINDIFSCVLESEFDVRILDEGVIKMFRLAQLAVEYQQFCLHYLDRSVYVLREEITSLAQELDSTKKSLLVKEEELRRFKRKAKHTSRPLTFGNENIATMILKSLSNKSDIFGNPSTSNADVIQYNKCNYCDKVFLNQLYLKSHISRRHSNMLDVPQKDVTENDNDSKLNDEIGALKDKLKEMENLLTKVNNERNIADPLGESSKHNNKAIEKIIMRDAEVSTDTECNLLDKIEEWKKEEHDKYNKEIHLLRTQIVEVINTFKNKEPEKPVHNDSSLIEKLHMTIQQQGAEILVLKQELTDTRLRTQKEEEDRKKEVETQMAFWVKRVEAQTKQYEALVQNLNDVAKEAKEARAQADSERLHAAKLRLMLEHSLANKTNEKHNIPHKKHTFDAHRMTNGEIKRKVMKKKKSKPEADSKTLESLHRKAQELLNIKSISSSDISNSSEDNPGNIISTLPEKVTTVTKENNFTQLKAATNNQDKSKQLNKETLSKHSVQKEMEEIQETKVHKTRKEKPRSKTNAAQKIGNGSIIAPGSPKKLVRAKITEEVNNRLVNIGVDPLKNRLPKSYYKKQKMHLQQQHESKSKKTPEYQKIKHTILAYLDANAPVKNNTVPKIADTQDYISPNKVSKAFSLTSVISNVRNKALSLVKSNETNAQNRRKEINAEVAKKAMALLKTPPSSQTSSPVKERKAKIAKAFLRKKDASIPKKRSLQGWSDKKHQNDVKNNSNVNSVEDDSYESDDHKYYDSAITSQTSKSIDLLIKSPARRPSSASAVDYNSAIRKLVDENTDNNFLRSQSVSNILEYKADTNIINEGPLTDESSSDELASLEKSRFKKAKSDENIPNKQTKGVLKNASSTSSLNKKKVLFDMDAIQMKSVSASPSQSITEKSDNNEIFELGLVNLDGEEWDISSIENEPLKEDTKIQVNSRTSPKIAELKQTIESQLARRNETASTALVGGIDLIPAALRNSSIAGSNTSLGSSILDDSVGFPNVNSKAVIKPKNKKITEKDDSEIDISEYSLDGILNKKNINSF